MAFSLAVYHQTVPNKKNLEKTQMLEFFGAGAKSCGDNVINVNDNRIINSDIALIQGWVTDDIQRPHLKLRNDVINRQLTKNRVVVTADSNLFLYADVKNSLHYLRYSFNGIFPNTGNYFSNRVDPTRWSKIAKNLNITVKDYRNNGNHILVCLQRNSGWSMGSLSVADWATSTISNIRQYTDRPIVVRLHPGDQHSKTYLPALKAASYQLQFEFSSNADIRDDFRNCWAVVNYNSSPTIADSIEGIPVFVTDPDRSQSRDIANLNLADIEHPTMPDRTAWLQRLSMCHWNFNELRSGEAWGHMRQFVIDSTLGIA